MNLPPRQRGGGVLALAAAALAAWVGLRFHLHLAPDLSNRLRDDAYYEFTWAWNVARGLGPVVSDGITTSGVQLLWSVMLVPVVLLVGPMALPPVASWLGFALHVATAGLWCFSTRDRLAGACLAACWLGHPLLVRESQNGQETALACFCLSALWLLRTRGLVATTVLAVLAGLARSELIVVAAGVTFGRHGPFRVAAWLPPVAAFVVVAAANRLLGGGWLPDSALPMAWLWHANHDLLGATTKQILQQWWWFARPILLGGPWALVSAMGTGLAVFLAIRRMWPTSLRAMPALAVGAASAIGVSDLVPAGWVAALLVLFPCVHWRRTAGVVLPASAADVPVTSRSGSGPSRRRTPRLPSVPLPQRRWCWLLLGAASVVVLHWAVRWYPRDYYLAPLVVIAFAAVRAMARWRLLLLVFALAQIADFRRVGEEHLAGQKEQALAGNWLASVVPPGARVGCFNAGLVAWMSVTRPEGAAPGARIVNLDGVVDSRAFAALRAGRLAAWLDEQGVAYVLDNPVQFSRDPRLPHACGHWFGDGFDPARDLVELARFDVLGVDNGRPGGDGVRLYGRSPAFPVHSPDGVAVELAQAATDWRIVRWRALSGQVLEFERVAGHRETLLAVDADTVAFVAIPRGLLGTGRLFVRGRAEPVLELRVL